MFLRIDAGLTRDCRLASLTARQNDKLEMTDDKFLWLTRRAAAANLSFVISEHQARM